jgi:hypothetical protein
MALLRTAATITNTSGTVLSDKSASTTTQLVYGTGIEGAAVSTPVVTTTTSTTSTASSRATR